MIEVELIKKENGSIDFKYGNIIIPHKECISSYSFWEELEQAANKAMFRLKTDNPKIGFDFDLSSMMVTKEERRERLINKITEMFPVVNAKLLCDIVDQEAAKITPHADEGANIDDHPNPFGKTTMDSDLAKFVIASVITNYEKQKQA